MELQNPKYKDIGMHVITSLFTVDKGDVKVLLIKRKNEPFKDKWALQSGALYNDELLADGAARELEEKTGIKNQKLKMHNIFDAIDRSPVQRMLGIGFIGIIDWKKVELQKKTGKTNDADWFNIQNIPSLAYDHNDIIKDSLEELKRLILSSDILKGLFPSGFTMPELQNVIETILQIKVDRRNFRKKILSLNLIEDTNKEIVFKGKKPAKLYTFKKKIEKKNIF